MIEVRNLISYTSHSLLVAGFCLVALNFQLSNLLSDVKEGLFGREYLERVWVRGQRAQNR